MIIGLTGKNASGKGEVAKYLVSRGFVYHSLSDELRAELKRRNLPVTRDTLTATGNELRLQHGLGVLAQRVLAKLEPDRHHVVDSFRNPGEVEVFRTHHDFVFVCVTASPKVRLTRLRERGRESDPLTLREFLKVEKREHTSKDPSKQQLFACQKLADVHILNNGTIKALHQRLEPWLSRAFRMVKRPGWDAYFMNIAKVVASRSSCVKRKVASVIVKEGRIISTGYNGTPRGVKNCSEGGCPRCNSSIASGTRLDECVCSHGEENAIVQAAYHGISLKGAALYTTFSPCLLCTKMIINSGITEVVYNDAYPLGETALSILKEARVKTRRISSHTS